MRFLKLRKAEGGKRNKKFLGGRRKAEDGILKNSAESGRRKAEAKIFWRKAEGGKRNGKKTKWRKAEYNFVFKKTILALVCCKKHLKWLNFVFFGKN